MRRNALLLAACLLRNTYASPIGNTQSGLQASLEDLTFAHHLQQPSRQLQGRFLHITDLHPDQHYKIHSSTDEDDTCHRGKGISGTYGAETSDCDTPLALVNATFKWIEENIKDTIDFVVWTGDSARHDSDEKIPRHQDEILSTNTWIAEKFVEVFGDNSDPAKPLAIPIISTFGNNDILPHNILLSGPNKWLNAYTDIWGKFIPEEQRHGFQRGGWYYVEVIPQKLAVFSLNTLYFFKNNAAVDGCGQRSEPGYEHLEWLRIQLQFMRQRGMKAILTGHVPPARTDSKQLWDETCWQKYTLWLQQYRDVIVGGLYGHMNIDHFMLHDTREVDLLSISGQSAQEEPQRLTMDDELTIDSANDYLEELRENWSSLPNPSLALKEAESNINKPSEGITQSKKKGKKSKKWKKGKNSKKDKLLKEIGGPWGERFHVTNVGPSVVPNFFPTLRVIEYNITGLEKTNVWANPSTTANQQMDWLDDNDNLSFKDYVDSHIDDWFDSDDEESLARKKKRKHKKPSNPDLIIPSPPSKSSPPGPAFSPQTLTLLGYTQYFANLTFINNDDFAKFEDSGDVEDDINPDKWHEGKHSGKHPNDKVPRPKPFQYQVEYDTFTDPVYKLKDLTVGSYLKLAHRIGQYEPKKGDQIDNEVEADEVENDSNDDYDGDYFEADKHKKKHKKKKHHRQNEKNKVWLRFLKHAFVGTLDDDELRSFDEAAEVDFLEKEVVPVGVHDGEL